jgi:hypothetical protein
MAIAAAVFATAWRPWRAEAPAGAGRWGAALAFGLAFLAAGYPVEAWTGFPPHESWKWVAPLAAAAALVGAADALGWLGGARWPLLAALAGGSAFLLAGAWVPGHWAWRAALASIVLAHCAVLGRGERAGASTALALCAAFAGGSVILLLAETLKLALLAGALAASLGAAAGLALWRPRIAPLRGAVPILAVALPGLLLSGFFLTYSPVPAWSFVLASAAPAAILAAGRPWLRAACAAAATAVAVAGAVLAH